VSGKTVGALVAAVVVAAMVLRPGAPDDWRIRNERPGDGAIVCFGDSLTAGFGAEPGRSYPDVLHELLGREVVNRGRNGDTAGEALARLDDVLALRPKVVVVTLGGNDMLQRLPVPQTVAAMDHIFDSLLDTGALVAFVAIDPPLASTARMDAIRTLCRERGILWIGDAMSGLWQDRARMSDQIHPNAAGYRVMAERVAAALRPRL
jgi:lysophospholipase L1-like esterase